MDTDVRAQLKAAGLGSELLAAVELALDEPCEFSVTVYGTARRPVTHELAATLEQRLATLGQLGLAKPFAGVVLREPDAVVIGRAATQDGPVEVLELFDGDLVPAAGLRAALVGALVGQPQPSLESYLHRFLLQKALRDPQGPAPTLVPALTGTIDDGALSWRALATAHQLAHLMEADQDVIAAVLSGTVPPVEELRAKLAAAAAHDLLDAIDAQFDRWTA